jgi:molybdopterin molybdotransferase
MEKKPVLKTRSVAEVSALIRERFGKERMDMQSVSLSSALGRALAEEMLATAFIPDFDRSTVDGYAVRAGDVQSCSPSSPVILQRIGQAVMGEHTRFSIADGQTAYVPTGGELPAGTEAVVMLEDTTIMDECQVIVQKPCKPGENLIFRGEDMKPGDLVLPAGKILKIADIGALAAMGIVDVPVRRRPRVGIISTGDELIAADEPLARVGFVRDVNTPMLKQAVLAAGGEPCGYGIVRDDLQAIRSVVLKAITECDLLLISGSTSMDSRDVAAAIIAELGEVVIHGIAVKPGKPTIVGVLQDKPVFGLPGNPVSVYFTFYLFVRPLLHSMQGTQAVERKVTLPLASSVVTNHGREEYLPVFLKDGQAHPIPWKSNLITRVSCADGFIRIPRDQNGIDQGRLVEVTYLDQ